LNLIKLNAIDSTSTFLKEMAKKSNLENYTIVVTKSQTKGRGQRESSWISEPNKNLTFSVFIKDFELLVLNQKYLNFAVCLAVFDVIKKHLNTNIFIKWPNDIMSANQKICGILIENKIADAKINQTILGIGLNVNQDIFPMQFKNISSLKKITGKLYDLDQLLNEIISVLKKRTQALTTDKFLKLEQEYLNVLYKKNIPSMFKTADNVLFMGKIVGVSKTGKLKIELENKTIKKFQIKEISFA
jgi:BirA family transcriptional regulator, biotin operon repressor / biotin---[acetyl-CoA-carboxylase] ligase